VKTSAPGPFTAFASRKTESRLKRRAQRAGVPLSAELTAGLVAYIELLARWNQKISLTSLPLCQPTDETLDRLIIEPLVAARYLTSSDTSVIDIGSGGGSPAIPLKLAVPRISLRMVESKTRKAAFLREAVRQLNLDGVDVETARFEELLARPGLHEAHDVATLRAVRIEARMLKIMQAFLRSDGRAFLFRSSSAQPIGLSAMPTLTPDAIYPLAESLGSRLEILRRRRFR